MKKEFENAGLPNLFDKKPDKKKKNKDEKEKLPIKMNEDARSWMKKDSISNKPDDPKKPRFQKDEALKIPRNEEDEDSVM